MEAAIKGRQWPLSVFGPFKEKPNLIPDVYDLSFEECRMQYLEAQATNNFPMYQQQLMQKIQEANSRMQSLMNVNKDVLQMAVMIYDNDNTSGGAASGQSNNAMSGVSGVSGFGVSSTNNAFGSSNAASIFGGSNANSIFGGGSTTTQQPQSAAASIFGGNQSSSTFGMNAAQAGSVFGGAVTNTPPQTSLFGQPSGVQQSTTSIFGSSNTFGGAQQPQQSIFSKANAPTFGSSAFGTSAQIAPAAPSGLFGSASVFANQQNPVQNTNAFGMQTSTQSAFGQPSSFGNASTSFGGPQHQTNAPPTNSNNIFGNLGQQATQAALASFTNQMPTQQQHQQQVQGSPFGALPPPPPPPAFGSNFQSHAHGQDPSVYSKMEELSQEQLAAFQADEFILGQIPNVPPPKELCN